MRAIEKRVANFFSVGVIFKGVVVCVPWAHLLSVGIVKMQHVMAFVTVTPVCPEGKHQPVSMVSVIVSVASTYANDVEGNPLKSTLTPC